MVNTLIIKVRKGIKKFMEEKVKACTDVLSSAQNRLTMGLVMVGIGAGLIASVYVRPLKN
jgi:hypothetical protein